MCSSCSSIVDVHFHWLRLDITVWIGKIAHFEWVGGGWLDGAKQYNVNIDSLWNIGLAHISLNILFPITLPLRWWLAWWRKIDSPVFGKMWKHHHSLIELPQMECEGQRCKNIGKFSNDKTLKLRVVKELNKINCLFDWIARFQFLFTLPVHAVYLSATQNMLSSFRFNIVYFNYTGVMIQLGFICF